MGTTDVKRSSLHHSKRKWSCWFFTLKLPRLRLSWITAYICGISSHDRQSRGLESQSYQQ